MKLFRHLIVCLLATVVAAAAADQSKPEFNRSLPPGTYGGARQLMVIGADGVVRYPDIVGLDAIVINADGSLEAVFPTDDGLNATVHLPSSAREHDRAVWMSGKEGRRYKATAIPHSDETYSFRLEVFQDGKLIAGAQVFCAICKPKLPPAK